MWAKKEGGKKRKCAVSQVSTYLVPKCYGNFTLFFGGNCVLHRENWSISSSAHGEASPHKYANACQDLNCIPTHSLSFHINPRLNRRPKMDSIFLSFAIIRSTFPVSPRKLCRARGEIIFCKNSNRATAKDGIQKLAKKIGEARVVGR